VSLITDATLSLRNVAATKQQITAVLAQLKIRRMAACKGRIRGARQKKDNR
jgi:hypothetical protein